MKETMKLLSQLVHISKESQVASELYNSENGVFHLPIIAEMRRRRSHCPLVCVLRSSGRVRAEERPFQRNRARKWLVFSR